MLAFRKPLPADDDIAGVPRGEVVERYAPLAKSVASKIAARLPASVELDDLISAGIVGLIDAIDKFDESKSNSFRKYAEIRIRGAILDELRSMDLVSRAMRRQTAKLHAAHSRARLELGREVTSSEIADRLGVSVTHYHGLIHKLQPVLVLSFEDLGLGADGERRNFEQYLRDPNAVDPSLAVHLGRVHAVVGGLVDALPEKQRIVITLYYFEGLNLREIGKVLDVTESRVSQLHSLAIRSLKDKARVRFASA